MSIADILAKDSDQFVESIQFNFMLDYNWLIGQYPAKNRSKPLTVVDGGSNKLPTLSHLKVVSVRNFKSSSLLFNL